MRAVIDEQRLEEVAVVSRLRNRADRGADGPLILRSRIITREQGARPGAPAGRADTSPRGCSGRQNDPGRDPHLGGAHPPGPCDVLRDD